VRQAELHPDPATARAGFVTLRDLTRRGPLALLGLRGEPAEFGEYILTIDVPPFHCTIDDIASVSCSVDHSDEGKARKFFEATRALVESITEHWDKQAGTTEVFAERFHYSDGPATISVALSLKGPGSGVWVFIHSALPPIPEENFAPAG
jgi:hypothetical protein